MTRHPDTDDEIETIRLGPPGHAAASTPPKDPEEASGKDPWIGRRVGPYVLESLLGQGGMGAVYAASRVDGSYEHQVAVKMVHRALPGATTALRFRQERQILARLDHPRIARILDGGVTDDRVPYLVMEKIDGAPITEMADRHGLTLAERVDLMIEVCRGVEAAHRSLVVHRDLKPANVLVDAERRVKLLDFGIAKLLDAEPGEEHVHTRTGFVAMTPHYASPEQILGDAIGTATDVYALGLILFELLVGTKAQPVTDTSPTGLFQAICGKEPPEPSRAVEALTRDEVEAGAETRGTSAARWPKQLRGDLDVIVARCLRKEPERRYGSAGELALDLERYRKGLPVEARPDSLAYRARKLVGRHRAAFSAAILALMALVAGLILAVGGMLRARDAEQRMADEAQAARQTADFLADLFEISDPKERSDIPSAQTLLDRAAESIENDLDRAPEVRARLLGTLGRVYTNLGAFDRAAEIYYQQLDALEQAEPDPEASAQTRSLLSDALNRSGQYDAGYNEAETALRSLEAVGLGDSLVSGRAYTNLGIATWFRGDYRTAHEHLLHALDLRTKHQDPGEYWRVQLLNSLAILEVELGQTEKARDRYMAAIQNAEELWGADNVRIAPTVNNLALLENADRHPERAEAYHRRALALRESGLGPNHPDVAESLNNLGDTLANMKRYDESREVLERALALRVDQLGPNHPNTLTTRFNLARNLRHTGESDAARAALDELQPLFEEIFGADHSYTSYVLLELASLDLDEGRLDSALDRAHRGLAIRAAAHGPDHRATRDARSLIEAIDEAMESR